MKKKDPVDVLLQNPLSYLFKKDEKNIVAITSRVRLARNIAKFSFPVCADVHELSEVRNLTEDIVRENKIVGAKGLIIYLDELSELDREFLYERRLISRKLVSSYLSRGLFVSTNEQIAVMVNEEDHLRIQSFQPGFKLAEAYKKAAKIEESFDEHLNFAFDNKLGYLSSCPTNVGTGLRASVMLHLPGLTLTGELDAALRALDKLNFAVRGIFGEGSENAGSLYQISNQITLGDSEEDIIAKINGVIEKIISYELEARDRMFVKKQSYLLDYIGRSYGLLKYAYLLKNKEVLNALSGVKLGVDMGIFANVDTEMVHKIYVNSGAAHLSKLHGKSFENSDEESIFRADYVRGVLRGQKEKQGE